MTGTNWKLIASIAVALVAGGGATAGLLITGNGPRSSLPGGPSGSSGQSEANLTNCLQWLTVESNGYQQQFHFHSDGYVDHSTKSPQGTSYRSYDGSSDNSRWTLNGSTISISIDNGYSHYRATLSGDRLLSGAARDRSSHWTWTAACPQVLGGKQRRSAPRSRRSYTLTR